MTLFKPTLMVERMLVERDSQSVYDEMFHRGLNVVRGDNSSGKSTVLNFLYYGLGGDLTDWSEAARLCSRVLLQVNINGDTATLARDVTTKARPAMDIFAGTIDDALEAPAARWLRFGYTRSEKRESFSQALFRLMDVPEVATDQSGNITMNQLLRILYADQLSPVETILKFQGTFDNGDLRDAIGRLVFGAHSIKFYQNEQELRRLDKDLDQVIGEYRSLLHFAGEAGEGFTYEFLQAERSRLERLAADLADQVLSIERSGGAASEDQPTLRGQEQAYAAVVSAQTALADAIGERDQLALKIADSDRYLKALRNKLESLQDSSMVADVIGDVSFRECPACHAVVEEPDIPHACYLCKEPFDEGHERGRIIRLMNETALQINQSEGLQRRRMERAGSIDEEISRLTKLWRSAAQRYQSSARSPTTESQLRLRELVRESGYVSRQLDELSRREKWAERLLMLAERREEISARMAGLRAENEALEREQQHRLNVAATVTSEEVKELLRNDLRRQDVFEDPRSVKFSFRDNIISVNDENYFSASSRAILKSSLTLGLLAASTKLEFMRHPRFCMIDSHENMGMEPVRSHNFQEQVLRVSRESKVEHQIVIGTAMIAPELDSDEFTVGRHYTRDQPALALRL
jgi:hypothetical protein